MLALLGLATIAVLLAAIMLNWLSPLVALILVPTAAALIGGFGLATAGFIAHGLSSIAPVAAMFVFAILYFGIITDAGVLDPIIKRILRAIGRKPTRIVMGTTLLALLVHLDGSGAVCFLVAIPTLLPLYEQLRMDRRVLACAASMAAGVNFLPWTGPTIRASAVLHISPAALFRPMVGVQLTGLVFIFCVSWWLGRREAKRLESAAPAPDIVLALEPISTPERERLKRPRLFWLNVLLTLAVLAAMISGVVEPALVFMIGTAIALVLNYPDVAEQRARIDAHARAALMMASILFAAGTFTGILSGSGMLTAMASAAVSHIPHRAAAFIPAGLGVLSMPLSLLFDPDSYYFGVMPVIAKVYAGLGGAPIVVAQASLLGQMTTGFPVSPLTPATFLVCGLSGVELGDHQRFSIPFLFAASIVMTAAAIAFGVIPS
ncbi:MAG TPA: citrate:proton symporter [Steroidobacteraceae bacterium]